jgi:regulating synaptic membrane exocytosis protein 2
MNITTPDLSHLTDDEKKIIESVINRQKSEEYLDDDDSTSHDYSSPSITISSRPYFSLNQSDVICQICQKTKFINEQSSRQCSVCRKRFCVRCCIRLKSQYYLCHQCREKQEEYFSSTKKISKQYLSDYILSQTHEENSMNQYGANQNRIVPQLKLNINDDEISSPESLSISDKKKRLLPEIKQNILRDFQYHSLEDRDLGQESTLKDSGIDTASSSTILNLISSDQFKQVFI